MAGSRSRLFLLDEVDAALDETNQAVVASLMRQLCSQRSSCQCLAVTHSAAFQANCDALVQVSLSHEGTVFRIVHTTQEETKRARRCMCLQAPKNPVSSYTGGQEDPCNIHRS